MLMANILPDSTSPGLSLFTLMEKRTANLATPEETLANHTKGATAQCKAMINQS